MRNILQELQRRNVIKAAISYAVIGWAILQVADILFPAFNISDEAIRYVLYTLIGVFPLWVIFAYVYEWTPTGFKKTAEVAEEASVHQETNKRLNVFIIGGLVLVIVLLVVDRVFNFTGAADPNVSKKSIAVLPFENMSGGEDAWFAKGITEDILTHISQIGDLRVLSNFTLRDYDSQGKTVEQIGKELGVGYLLTGSIRKAGEQLRITCQLVQVNPEEQEWAENYDKRMDDVFAIQTQVAEEVAHKLQARLSPKERERLVRIPTENIAAYNIYLKGREEYNKYEIESMKLAIDLFKEAIAMDTTFGLAYAGLADSYTQGVAAYAFLSREYLDTAALLAEKATLLTPEAPEPWKAWGLAFQCAGNHDAASTKYRTALEKDPNHLPAIGNLASIAGSRGRIDEAIALFKKSIQLNPLSFKSYSELGNLYRCVDLPEKAAAALQKAEVLKADDLFTLYYTVALYATYNDTALARTYNEKLIALGPEDAYVNELAGDMALWYDTAFAKACMQRALNAEGFDPASNYTVLTTLGYLLWEEGKQDSARSWLEPQRIAIEKVLEERSDDIFISWTLLVNYAIQGEREKALALLEKRQGKGDSSPPLEYTSYPPLRSLLKEPRFQAVMKKKQKGINEMQLRVLADEEAKVRGL